MTELEVPGSPDRKLVFRADPQAKEHGPSLCVYSVGGSTEPVPLVASQLRASEQEDQLPASLDDRLDTAWAATGAQKPGDFLELRLRAPRRICSIELRLGTPAQLWGRRLTLYASRGMEDLRPLGSAVSALSAGRSLEKQVAAQIFAFEPVCADRRRIVQEGRSGRLRAATASDALALPCRGAR